MYCELQRKQKPVPNRGTGNKKLQKNQTSNHPWPLNQFGMGVFPFVEGSLNGRSVKDIVLVIVRSVNQVSRVVKQFLDRLLGESHPLDSGVFVGIQASRNEGVHDVIPFVFGMLKDVPIIDLAGMKEFVVP